MIMSDIIILTAATDNALVYVVSFDEYYFRRVLFLYFVTLINSNGFPIKDSFDVLYISIYHLNDLAYLSD